MWKSLSRNLKTHEICYISNMRLFWTTYCMIYYKNNTGAGKYQSSNPE
jgi:hypothetical protein